MGDRLRFVAFAEAISRRFPDRSIRIADVASGNAGMQSALRAMGYLDVVSWDKRKRNATGRPMFRYGHFNSAMEDMGYDLVIGMHPDGATDHIIDYAVRHRRHFMICPCCVIPSSDMSFKGTYYGEWVGHLAAKAVRSGMRAEHQQLPIGGRNLVITGLNEKGVT